MILNPLMLWGAGLGIWMFVAVSKMEDASNHRGPVTVDFDEGGVQRMTEAEFKRYTRGNAELAIFFAAVFWITVAYCNKQKVKSS